MSARGRAGRALKLVLANVAVWLTLEAGAWIVLSATTEERPPPTDERDWLYQAQVSFEGGLYEWDEHCLWRLQPGYVSGKSPGRRFWGDGPLTINEHGMRGPARPVAKPDGIRRILILGGSHPMGMYVNYEESYGAVLERMLNAEGGRWQVLNASAPGWTSFQGREYLAHYGLAFEPDIVITDLGVNDTLPLSPEFPRPDHEVKRPPAWAAKARGVLRFSAVYRLLKRWLQPPPEPEAMSADATQRVPPDRHRDNVLAMRKLGQEHGFRVLAVSQFSVDLHGSGRANCIFREEGLEPVADVCGLWTAMGSEAGRYFVDPIHANAEGHALIAQRIHQALTDLGWVGSK